MPVAAFLGMLVGVAFLALMVWLISRAVKAGRQQVAASSELDVALANLTGQAGATRTYGVREVAIGARRVSVALSPGGKNAPPTLRLTLPVEVRTAGARIEHGAYRETARRRIAGQLAVLFRKETSNDRFGKRIGLNVEHDTGDDAFDSEVYVESDASHDDLDALLSDTTTRQAIHQILGHGFTNVEMFRGASTVQATLIRPTAEAVARAPQVVEKLGLIADNLPAFDNEPVGRATSLRTSVAALTGMLGGFGAFVFAVLASTRWNVVVPGAMFECALAGLGGWVLLCGVTYFLVRGRSDALRAFSFVFFCWLFGMPSIAVGTAATVNGANDPGAETPHDVRITRRWITTSKNNKTYHLEVESWRPDRGRVEVPASSALYGAVFEGGYLRVSTKPGRLGWEWISGVQRLAPGTTPGGW